MKNKWIWPIAGLAFLVLGLGAVWFGGLNQDEGWYLYAANLVAEGKLPYRDFAFTQGPVMPWIYSWAAGIWREYGLLGARIFNLAIGLLGISVCAAIAKRLKGSALATFLLLGCNLYHLYYLAIPKTYALAGLLAAVAFFCLTFEGRFCHVLAGLFLALSAGTRISMGGLLLVAVVWYLVAKPRELKWLWLGAGGLLGLTLVYAPFLLDETAREGLWAAQAYHAAREGFDPFLVIGSMSRLVRWYLPLVMVLVLMVLERKRPAMPVLLAAPVVVAVVQLAAPFPYDDYQVPLMGLLAAAAGASFDGKRILPLCLLAMAVSFGSPLLEKWSVNGQDRFWPDRKDASELEQLMAAAKEIEAMDPGGKQLLTQDLYLAVETGRTVPEGLEMGPFSMLTHEEWKALLELAPCKLAALSGYTFAIEPPRCNERDFDEQMEYWGILKKRYALKRQIGKFGQNATTLLILERKDLGE